MNIEKYQENGYCIVQQLISSDVARQIHSEIINYSSKHANKNKLFCYPERILRFLDPRFYKANEFKIENIILGMKLLEINNSNKMNRIKKTLGLNKLYRIDSYITEISLNDITKWHCDQSYGGATDPGLYFNGNREEIPTRPVNKFFHHFTDVRSGNGAFAYLPKSHIVGIAIRKIINSGKLNYEPFMDLKDALPLVKKNHQIFLKEKLLTEFDIDFFVTNAENALNERQDFSLNVDAGGMIIFNDLGYHQGTAPKISQRLVVRYFY